MSTVQTVTTLESTTCVTCGVVFAMPDYMLTKRREDGGDFYCPNGHTLLYTKSEVQKLRAALQVAQQEAINAREQVRLTEARAKRIERRALAGICPKCGRTFVQVKRHIASKHPEAKA